VNVDCILLQLYGLIGLHLRVIMRMRKEGERDRNLFLRLGVIFRGGFWIKDLRAYAMVG
jgi:hypothetical protein